MKKIVFLLVPLVIGLVSCQKSIPNQEAVNELKALLNKQDLSDFTSKGFACMFTQEYDVLDVYKDDEEGERSSSYFNYVGLGFLDSYYVLNKEQYSQIIDAKGEINTFDAIAIGEGGYRITQTVDTSSFYRDGGTAAVIKNLDISQQVTLKATDKDLIVYNVLDVSDKQYFDESTHQNFNGSINKELLFDSVSPRAFNDIFSSINLFDSPGNVEYLDKLYFSICRDLKTKNDKEISEFISNNQISLKEVEDHLELNFVYEQSDIEEDYLDIIFPGAIKGTLTYDKVTGSFDEFSYEIKYVDEKYDKESGSLKTTNMIFTCSGKTTRGPMGDMWTPDDPTIYDNVVDFLEDVREEVVPPNII